MDKKLDQLQAALTTLPTGEAVVLARKLETQRALGHESLPTDAILAALRPQLRTAAPQRIPTLRRLAVMGFEDFLSDDDEEKRVPGAIPRRSAVPWWQACERFAPEEIKTYASELARHVGAGDWTGLGRLGVEVWRAAHGWTEAILAGIKNKKLTDAAIRKTLSDAKMQIDFAEIARLLAIAEPLRAALDAVTEVAARHNHAQGRRILDLSPDAVTQAKQQYLTFTEQHGVDSRYVALGLMHRLQRPCEILRLGRALSWNNDTMMRDTELGIVANQLVRKLQALTRSIVAMAPQKGTADTVNYDELQQSMLRYIENAEGMVGEFGFHRDSEWGEQILETRNTLAKLFDGERLKPVVTTVLAAMPQKRGTPVRGVMREEADLDMAPAPLAVEQAIRAARFLMLLVQKGSRHGLSSPARTAIDEVGEEIANRTDRLFDTLQREPRHAIVPSHVEAAARIADTLFEDGRGAVMTRRLKNLQKSRPPQRTAAPA